MKIIRILSFIVLIFLISHPSWAAINKVQDCASTILTATGTLSTSCTLTSVAAGNTIVLGVHSGAAVTVSDNNGGVYSNVLGNIYMAPSHAAGTTIVTITSTNVGVFISLVAAEFSGLGVAPTFDGPGAFTAYTADTTIQTGTQSTIGANPELVFCFGFTDSVQTPTGLIDYGAGGGSPTAFTNQGQTSAAGGETAVGAWQSVAVSGPFGCQWTITSANNQGIMAEILPGNPSIAQESVCPSGANGPCIYPPTTIAGLAQQVCPAGITCESIITNASASCSPGAIPTGVGSNICDVAWNGTIWVED